MATRGRPKSLNVESTSNASIEENDAQSLTVNDLLKIIEGMQKQIDSLKNPLVIPVNISSENEFKDDLEDELDNIEIRPDAYIRVISLTPFELNLSTLGGGRGKVFTFTTFGATKRIMYSDLLGILEAHQNFLKDGLFYIMNRNVIRKNGLDDIYANILSKDKIENILHGGRTEDIVGLFRSANKNQQTVIVQMLVDKMISGENVDLNLIDKLSRESGIKIQEKYESTKEYLDSMKVES